MTKNKHMSLHEAADQIMSPELRAGLLAAAQANGIDPARLRVGSGRNSINPQTGQLEFADTVQPLCQTKDGRILPYSDIGLGYVSVPDNGSDISGVGAAVGQAASQTAMPTQPKAGGIAGGGASGPWTSPASSILRDATDSACFGPLRSITGTASVGGSIGRALPFAGAALGFDDYMKMQDALKHAPMCKPVA